ncbi:atherin-like [Equus asinus]|uniref:atherin-like n=1 Tax=Equus asinus TaxID=9793 RepID=UPI0038F750B9
MKWQRTPGWGLGTSFYRRPVDAARAARAPPAPARPSPEALSLRGPLSLHRPPPGGRARRATRPSRRPPRPAGLRTTRRPPSVSPAATALGASARPTAAPANGPPPAQRTYRGAARRPLTANLLLRPQPPRSLKRPPGPAGVSHPAPTPDGLRANGSTSVRQPSQSATIWRGGRGEGRPGKWKPAEGRQEFASRSASSRQPLWAFAPSRVSERLRWAFLVSDSCPNGESFAKIFQ